MLAYISFQFSEINHAKTFGISIQSKTKEPSPFVVVSFPLAHTTACVGTSANVQRGANVFTQFPSDEARKEEPETMLKRSSQWDQGKVSVRHAPVGENPEK